MVPEIKSDATRHFTDIHFDRFEDSLPTNSIMFVILSFCLSVCLLFVCHKPTLHSAKT